MKMKLLPGPRTMSGFEVMLRKIWFRAKVVLVIAAIIEGVALWNNPVLLLKQDKAWNGYWENRAHKIKYELIKETKGRTIADMYDCGREWGSLGNYFKECYYDVKTSFFR